jgi:hypothetical protein
MKAAVKLSRASDADPEHTNLGRAMAAKLNTGVPGWTAWVFVRPVVASKLMWDTLREAWTLQREASRHFEIPSGFVVRYTRLSESHLAAELRDDLDLAMRVAPPEDWFVIVVDIDQMERLLQRFLQDLDILRLPSNVDYPEAPPEFARERTLEDVLGAA